MLNKPARRKVRDLVEGPGFLEEMRRCRNEHELPDFRLLQLFKGRPIETEHDIVFGADDEQGGCGHTVQGFFRQIGATAARDDGPGDRRVLPGGNQGCCRSGARAEPKLRFDGSDPAYWKGRQARLARNGRDNDSVGTRTRDLRINLPHGLSPASSLRSGLYHLPRGEPHVKSLRSPLRVSC